MKAQIMACVDDFVTTSESLANKAAAIKAGYGSWKAARMAATFDIVYPETMIKKSAKAADAGHGGWTFQPSFADAKVFEGTVEHSTKGFLKRRLRENMPKHQSAIDAAYPPDQPQHSRSNAIFSDILRRGFYQADGFLEAIVPFYNLMTGANAGAKDAWDNKMLTFVLEVWERVQAVRTVTSESTSASMIFGIMKATDLLDRYSELGWIRHPDVSSALVIASLQRDGKGNKSSADKLGELATAVATNKTAWTDIKEELKQLKRKNPTWNT
jgi:hypothetical protein